MSDITKYFYSTNDLKGKYPHRATPGTHLMWCSLTGTHLDDRGFKGVVYDFCEQDWSLFRVSIYWAGSNLLLQAYSNCTYVPHCWGSQVLQWLYVQWNPHPLSYILGVRSKLFNMVSKLNFSCKVEIGPRSTLCARVGIEFAVWWSYVLGHPCPLSLLLGVRFKLI